MIVLVTGSRDWTDARPLADMLDRARGQHEELYVVHGAARGADSLAAAWARCSSGVTAVPFPAKWKEHAEPWCAQYHCRRNQGFCMGAGPRRNQEMLDYALAVIDEHAQEVKVLAFKRDFDRHMRKGGTEDMVKRSLDAGLDAFVYDGQGWTKAELVGAPGRS